MTRRKTIRRRKSATRAQPRAIKRHSPVATNDQFDAMVAANARALGLTLDPSWEASVKFNLQLILSHAARVDEFCLPDDAEPAPVFRA